MAEIGDMVPPWMQAAITLGVVAAAFGASLIGKLRDPSRSKAAFSREDLADLFQRETQQNRDLLMSNREILLSMRDSLLRIAASNEEISHIVRDQASDERYKDIVERAATAISQRSKPHD